MVRFGFGGDFEWAAESFATYNFPMCQPMVSPSLIRQRWMVAGRRNARLVVSLATMNENIEDLTGYVFRFYGFRFTAPGFARDTQCCGRRPAEKVGRFME